MGESTREDFLQKVLSRIKTYKIILKAYSAFSDFLEPSLSSAFQSIPDIKIEEKRPATMPTIRGSAKF